MTLDSKGSTGQVNTGKAWEQGAGSPRQSLQSLAVSPRLGLHRAALLYVKMQGNAELPNGPAASLGLLVSNHAVIFFFLSYFNFFFISE